MSAFTIFIIIVAIIVLVIYITIKSTLRESVVVNKILEVSNRDDFSSENLQELRRLLDSILRMPNAITYDVSGDHTVLSQMSYELNGANVSEAKEIIHRIIEDYNNNVDKKVGE